MADDPLRRNADEEIKRLGAENAKLKRDAVRQLAERDQMIAQLKEDGMTDADEIERHLRRRIELSRS
jgi:hypothetical protein